MILILCALQSEAQIIIEKKKLKKISSNPKIYKNQEILLIISGIGKQNTINSLEYIFKNNTITKAVNIGIAGCSDDFISIGELFCTNKSLNGIKYMQLKTVETPKIKKEDESLLYDMEGEYFFDITKKYLNEDDIYIFKIVSDHLEDKVFSKEFVKKLIFNHYNVLEKYLI